jgi:hypothetical protein
MYAVEHQDSSNFPKAVLWQHERPVKLDVSGTGFEPNLFKPFTPSDP